MIQLVGLISQFQFGQTDPIGTYKPTSICRVLMYSRFVWSHTSLSTHTCTTHVHCLLFPSIPLVWSVSGLVGYVWGSSSPFHSFAPSGSLFTLFSLFFFLLARVASDVGRFRSAFARELATIETPSHADINVPSANPLCTSPPFTPLYLSMATHRPNKR